MLRIVLLIVAIIVFLPYTAFGAEPPAIGSYQDVAGQVTVLHSGQKDVSVVKNEGAVYTHDRIETGGRSRVTVHFIDNTTIVMGPNGRMTVGEYIFDPAEPGNGKVRLQILKAAFSFTDGKLGQEKHPDVRLDLDLGWLAIRGTKLWRGMRDHQCWIYLESGDIEVGNDGGHVALRPGQATRMGRRNLAPTTPTTWHKQDISWIAQQIERPTK